MIGHPSSTVAGVRVLHVDDHAVNRRLVQAILMSFGYESTQAGSGAEALEHLRRERFELVLMDVNMPGMSGIEVVGRLGVAPGLNGRTPVIALTSEVGRTADDYRALGFAAFLPKPFTISGLMQAIDAAVLPPRRRPLGRVA